MGNWIVLGILLVLVCVSAKALYRQKKRGGCGCGCSGCTAGCTEEGRRNRTGTTGRTKEEKKE